MTTRPHIWTRLSYSQREEEEWLAWLPSSTRDRAEARLESARRLGMLTPAAVQRIERATAAIHPPTNTEHPKQ